MSIPALPKAECIIDQLHTVSFYHTPASAVVCSHENIFSLPIFSANSLPGNRSFPKVIELADM
jgi:hypothetical protein